MLNRLFTFTSRTVLVLLFSACATSPQLYLSASGDLWAYGDQEVQAFVGTGRASAEATASGLTYTPPFPTEWIDQAAWFRHEVYGEVFIDIGDPWPWWMATKLRVGEEQALEAQFGVDITFEPNPALAPEV